MNETNKIKSLWGDLPVEEIRTPHIVLREQASILTEETEGKLVGTVCKNEFKDTSKHTSYLINQVVKSERNLLGEHKREIVYIFSTTLEIRVPSFNNYSISIVQMDYPLEMYPLRIINLVTDNYRFEKCESESELNQKLAAILSSGEVRRIIAGLLTEIRADEKEVNV